MKFVHRFGLAAAVFSLNVLLCSAAAPAAVEISTGIRYVMDSGTPAECSAKAQTALNAYLQNTSEQPQGSGDWIAFGPVGGVGAQTTSAVVRCYPTGKGYVVTFTCAVEMPGSPYSADALCLDVAHNFSGKPVTTLASPTPMPTGCNTLNLVGTWTCGGKTLTMDPSGGLTDSDGVSGNWILTGMTGTLTYYGNHEVTLSADGKHLRGSGYDLTRKC